MKPDARVREHLRERIEDLLLEYVAYDEGASLFQHDLLCSCRELENYFSKQLNSVSSIRTQNS